jgi:hypothetical protein
MWVGMPLLLPGAIVFVLLVPGLNFSAEDEATTAARAFSVKHISQVRWMEGGNIYFDVALRGGRIGRLVFGQPAPSREEAVAKLNAEVAVAGGSDVEASLLSAGGLTLSRSST